MVILQLTECRLAATRADYQFLSVLLLLISAKIFFKALIS